jgi:F0F1-type ATP synthase membrane subunit b/b'
MADPTLTAPVITQWGAYGVILIVLFLALVWVVKELRDSYKERIAESRVNLTETLKAVNESTQALKDMTATVNAVLAVVKARP